MPVHGPVRCSPAGTVSPERRLIDGSNHAELSTTPRASARHRGGPRMSRRRTAGGCRFRVVGQNPSNRDWRRSVRPDMPKKNGPGIELLADPTRRRLIAAIAIRPRRPSSLAQEIGLSRPATARQLHLLEHAGLIRATRAMTDRRGIVFTVDPRNHGRITAWLAGTDIGLRLKAPFSGELRPATE